MQFHYMKTPSLYLVQNSYFLRKKSRYKIAFQTSGKSIIKTTILYQIKINT